MSDYQPTQLPGGVAKIIQIAEDMRDLNSDGYLSAKSGFLLPIDGFGMHITKAIVCSPFTGNVIGCAFDPQYPRGAGEAHKPLFDGGTKPLPFAPFYKLHNDNDDPVGSIVKYNLGKEIDPKQMRRGDQVALDWFPSGGHSVFCWDVHLNSAGEVDAFQMLGAHGGAGGIGFGVFVYGCWSDHWLTGTKNNGSLGTGSLKKARDKIFIDDDDTVAEGVWFTLPGVDQKKFDTSTLRKKPKRIAYARQASPFGISVKNIRVARFHTDQPPPQPYCMKDGSAPANADVPGHIDAQPTTIKGNDLQKDPGAVNKVEPKPAQQDDKKPLQWQKDVEDALHHFFAAKWIDSDPGESEDINDSKTQAAVKDLQKKFKLLVDGIVGPQTRGCVAKQLPACLAHQTAQQMLGKLFKGGKIKSDPGSADGTNHDQCKGAVTEFQKANGLEPTGVPDADTQAKLQQLVTDHSANDSQHGLDPALLALYWLGNNVAPGGNATLRLVTMDLKSGTEIPVSLKDASGKEVDAGVKLVSAEAQCEVQVPIPAAFGEGAIVSASVKASLDGGKTLALSTPAPLYVRNAIQPIAAGDLQTFFKFKGTAGESNASRDHVYVAYKVPGKPNAWFMKGRLMIDVDGAPNCYHPDNKNVRTDYLNFDVEKHDGALDWLANGGHPGNWFGVVTDDGNNTGTPIVQGASDPCPGFHVSSTSLADKSKKRNDPKRYVDARVIPYMAWPQQIWLEKGARFERATPGPTGTLGDILTVVNPKADDAHRYAHAIFADMGGADDPHFGEGSPALGRKIHAAGHADPDLLYII
ncbi:MAG: peptidoglycan-binding domain-containing protein [Myxococcales bacterium]